MSGALDVDEESVLSAELRGETERCGEVVDEEDDDADEPSPKLLLFRNKNDPLKIDFLSEAPPLGEGMELFETATGTSKCCVDAVPLVSTTVDGFRLLEDESSDSGVRGECLRE